jgi:hypothetical protein
MIILPIKTVSLANEHCHWRVRSKRAKEQRYAAAMVFPAGMLSAMPGPPLTIRLTRRSPGVLDDDNLPPALKSIRDGIADKLGIDDRDPRVKWFYAQERTKGYAVCIEIFPGDAIAALRGKEA